ncbi:MAG: hypothetical protein E7551_10415 [Ruminococcaceae bacterium]|nr:hypothetical protein [Oscillospiraceae bacterium]
MKNIALPEDFPSESTMLAVLKKTIEKSWKTDLDIEDIEIWLKNFTGNYYDLAVERRLALWLLCNFTYYNIEEVNHMCRILFKNLLHKLMVDNDLSTEEEAEACIRNTSFTSIGKASESGGFILYHFRQESKLDLERFIFPTNMLETKSDAIVCVDDVMMSGGTAERFFHNNTEALTAKKIYYAALITTEQAVETLEKLGITVVYCAKLDERSKAFSENSLAFYKFPEVKVYAKELAKGYGTMIEPKKPLGHKDGEYCFGMFYNIPNNSLPIFWSDKNNWNPIFLRKEKYQNAKQAKREYSFFI